MNTLLQLLEEHWKGIAVVFCALGGLAVLAQWVCWMFGLGRFGRQKAATRESSLRFVIADLLVKIINDFRHLLALVVMLIFAMTLLYALVRAGQTTEDINKALQSVVATMGGLIGSIIGYYFGESAGQRATAALPPAVPNPVSNDQPRADNPITAVPGPEDLRPGTLTNLSAPSQSTPP